MKNEITNPQVCVLVRGGLELWIDANRQDEFMKRLEEKDSQYVKIGNQIVNKFEVLGVFTPDAMEERQRRKDGQWKCLKGNWHEKNQGCGCTEYKKTVTAHVVGIGEVTYKTNL